MTPTEPAPSSLPAGIVGLSSDEAARRLVRFGPNRLVAHERAAWLKEAASLLGDPMALMLLGAAALYFSLGEKRDAIVMLVALAPVLGVDVFLEARSRSALRKLAERVTPRARVVRDGAEAVVPTADVVPGDIIVLREGDVVHADGVVRWAANLATDEAALTGESEPQQKQASAIALPDPALPLDGAAPAPAAPAPVAPSQAASESVVIAGSMVLTGHGFAELTATGGKTRYGEIAALVASAGTSATPMQRQTMRLGRQLGVVAVAVAAGVVALGLLRGWSWSRALLAGVSLAIAAMPEEFPLVFALFLSMGAWRLGRHGVLVRRLASVETLGSTTVICTDKTGTLTRGQFAVDAVISLAADVSAPGLLEAAVLACEPHAADPMERAIVAAAESGGAPPAAIYAAWTLVRDHDFDPIGKHMSHVWQPRVGGGPAGGGDRGACRIVAKGALEGVLEHCAASPEIRAAAEAENTRLAGQAMRVLAVAGRFAPMNPGASRADDEQGLALLGLLGFRDPIRPEVAAAVDDCQRAGVHIKVITGDHALTAHAIADQAGIAHEHDGIVTGPELDALPPAARDERIEHATIFARITPAQKHMIVAALKRRGEVVAMTGDGINDAPALRLADIGVSMGQRATEVARASADMILLDDNFASIVTAVREGRQIFRDIQRAFLYLIAFHVPIVGLALLAPIVGVPLLLLPVHLVWLELIVHPVSALAFPGDASDGNLMREPPRAPGASLLPARAAIRSVVSGGLLTAAVFALYALVLPAGEAHARSLAMATLLLGYQMLVIVERAALDRTGPLFPKSPRFWIVWLASAVSLLVVVYAPPLADVFHVQALTPTDWGLALAGATVAVGWRFVRR